MDRAVHLASDDFFHFITSGYIEPWQPNSHGQNAVIMDIVGRAATGYASAGYQTVIDGIIIPGYFFEPLRASIAEAGFDVAYVVLRPPLKVAIDRAVNRGSSRLSDPAVVEQLWNSFADLGPLERYAIDNGLQTAGQTAALLEKRLATKKLTV